MEFLQLSQYLKKSRGEMKITQAQLAEALGDVHVQFVSNWERGLCAPPNHCFQKLISVLNLDREKLVKVMLLDSKEIITAKVFTKGKKVKKKAI